MLTFLEFLKEMALGRWEVDDPNRLNQPASPVYGQPFKPSDVKAIQSPVVQKNVSNVLQRFDDKVKSLNRAGFTWNFAFMFINHDFGNNSLEAKAQEYFRRLNIPTQNAINVVIVSNPSGEGAMPMTPWIMIHRAAHAVIPENDHELLANNDAIQAIIFEMVNEAYGKSFRYNPDIYRNEPEDEGFDVTMKWAIPFFDFRSTREPKYHDNLMSRYGVDLIREIVTAYIWSGGRIPMKLPEGTNMTPERLQFYQEKLGEAVHQSLERCVGKIIVEQ